MPVAPPTFRPRSGRGSVADQAEATRAYERRRRDTSPTRALYNTVRWRRDVREVQLAAHPLCISCEAVGEVVPATICDHVTPHRGDVEAFWRGPFQSLCKPCHDVIKQREEHAARLEGEGGRKP